MSSGLSQGDFRNLCLGLYISLSLPDEEETEWRMSFGVCQLNDALQHAWLTQLICVYLEVAFGGPGGDGWAATVPVPSRIGPTQQRRRRQSGGSHDGQRLIRGSPEQVGFAPMPQGLVKAANISAYGANTPPITYLFILSG